MTTECGRQAVKGVWYLATWLPPRDEVVLGEGMRSDGQLGQGEIFHDGEVWRDSMTGIVCEPLRWRKIK